MIDYSAWREQNLTGSFVRLHGKRVHVCASPVSNKPLLLLVHGISGDHNGLVPLAAELANDYRVLLVDLPGHGKTTAVRLPDANALQVWFKEALVVLEKEFGPIDFIVAHSFGCSVVLSPEILKHKKVLLINPVPTPSPMYERYARVIVNSAHFWAHIYNWRPFIVLRGMTLAKIRTREAMKRVRWTGFNSKATYAQIVFQAGLVSIIRDRHAYDHAGKGKIALVICGMSDTTACERDSLDMRQTFGKTPVEFLRGGHLLPMEAPEAAALLIRETMVH